MLRPSAVDSKDGIVRNQFMNSFYFTFIYLIVPMYWPLVWFDLVWFYGISTIVGY